MISSSSTSVCTGPTYCNSKNDQTPLQPLVFPLPSYNYYKIATIVALTNTESIVSCAAEDFSQETGTPIICVYTSSCLGLNWVKDECVLLGINQQESESSKFSHPLVINMKKLCVFRNLTNKNCNLLQFKSRIMWFLLFYLILFVESDICTYTQTHTATKVCNLQTHLILHLNKDLDKLTHTHPWSSLPYIFKTQR